MENLLAIFNKIQQVSPLPFFTTETVIVQNAGMQHWLNMSVANSRGISMNIDYALPAQFLWKLLKSITSEDKAPDQSPYSREVLTWRIHQLLNNEQVVSDEDFKQVTHYWQLESNKEQAEFKRYHLAQKCADLYEQYLIFRPEWIDAWCQKDYALAEITSLQPANAKVIDTKDVIWQGKLWQMLHQQMAYNPVDMMAGAIANIEHKKHLLPKRLSLFAINAMAPMWLNFLEQIGHHTQIHFFHLNPCFDYWGDIVTDKMAIKRLNQWTENVTDNNTDAAKELSSIVGNPLLANLGQQGREFIALLQSVSTIDVEAYEQFEVDEQNNNLSVLHCIQQDILTLADKRKSPCKHIDESIVINSCHSALREVQALHDWLLHQFNNDSSLTPKDVLVMCPQIEDYAPYVNAVFARGWQDLGEDIPPLPCSIADRNSKDADPLVAGFMELLDLPDSRFQVTHILSLLRLPAIQEKLGIVTEDVDKVAHWLDRASVHWGLDQTHKNAKLHSEHLNSQYTWQQGLSRLLQGFAYGDHDAVVGNQYILADVEGTNAELLGKLMLFLEQLQTYLAKLSQRRTASQWQLLLSDMLSESFAATNEYSIDIIVKAIALLGEYTTHACYEESLPLAIIKDFLISHFSEPDTSRQFMVGQVTFCSMLPMRSIPFKVIAILGLNDGQYPRQRQPLAFDLIANTQAQLGDRSRRGDDRYLFLEAIISARQSLYLSYQGRSIKTNAAKQPSIVLNELIDYLTRGYDWDLSDSVNSQLRQPPMQPFSARNYIAPKNLYPSFDANWLNLINRDTSEASSELDCPSIGAEQLTQQSIELADLIKFFQHPSKWYAQRELNLFFNHFDVQLEDDEPFVPDHLAAYQLREALLDIYLKEDDNESLIESTIQAAVLSGKYADTPLTQSMIDDWRDNSEQFADQILASFPEKIKAHPIQFNLDSSAAKFELASQLPISGSTILCYRSSTPKFKDLFTLFLYQLSLQLLHQKNELTHVTTVRGAYFNTKSQKVVHYQVAPIEQPLDVLSALLVTFSHGQQQPLLLNGMLVDKLLSAKNIDQQGLEKLWQGDINIEGLGDDGYIKYFWRQCPNLDDILPQISTLFSSMYTNITKVK